MVDELVAFLETLYAELCVEEKVMPAVKSVFIYVERWLRALERTEEVFIVMMNIVNEASQTISALP